MKETIRAADIMKYAKDCVGRAKVRKSEGHWATGYALEQEAGKMVDVLAIFAADTEQDFGKIREEVFGDYFGAEEGENDGRK